MTEMAGVESGQKASRRSGPRALAGDSCRDGLIRQVWRVKSLPVPVERMGMMGNTKSARQESFSRRSDFGLRELSGYTECPECAPVDSESASASVDLTCEGCGRPRPEGGSAWSLTAALDALWAGKCRAPDIDQRRP